MNPFNDDRIKNMERFITNLKGFLKAGHRFDSAYKYAIEIEQKQYTKKERNIDEDFFDEIFNIEFSIEFSIDENGRTHWK